MTENSTSLKSKNSRAIDFKFCSLPI